MLKNVSNFTCLLIIIAIVLAVEIVLRLNGKNAFDLEQPNFWETNFIYDSHLGWFSKVNFVVQLKEHGFPDIVFDRRGFPVLPAIQNDHVKNENKVLFVGRCETYGGPMIGSDMAFLNLLAKETSGVLDFDVIGVSGYSLYQEYLLYKKYSGRNNALVIISLCPIVDFYLNTKYYFSSLNNRLVPRPVIVNGTLQHDPVPYVKSYWESELPVSQRVSFTEALFSNCFSLSRALYFLNRKNSFNVDLTKKILCEMQTDIEAQGGRLAVFCFNWLPDNPDVPLDAITDEFVLWLENRNIDVIDARRDLVGYSLKKFGDPTHYNDEGNIIIKNKILDYLKKIDFI
jgi:hypothetical protein